MNILLYSMVLVVITSSLVHGMHRTIGSMNLASSDSYRSSMGCSRRYKATQLRMESAKPLTITSNGKKKSILTFIGQSILVNGALNKESSFATTRIVRLCRTRKNKIVFKDRGNLTNLKPADIEKIKRGKWLYIPEVPYKNATIVGVLVVGTGAPERIQKIQEGYKKLFKSNSAISY